MKFWAFLNSQKNSRLTAKSRSISRTADGRTNMTTLSPLIRTVSLRGVITLSWRITAPNIGLEYFAQILAERMHVPDTAAPYMLEYRRGGNRSRADDCIDAERRNQR